MSAALPRTSLPSSSSAARWILTSSAWSVMASHHTACRNHATSSSYTIVVRHPARIATRRENYIKGIVMNAYMSLFIATIACLTITASCVDDNDAEDPETDSFLGDGKQDTFGVPEGSLEAIGVLGMLRG